MRSLLVGVLAVFFTAAMGAQAASTQLTQLQPYYGAIAEDQAFILRFNQAINTEAILAHSYCASSAVGEHIPLRQLPSDQAQSLLDEQSYDYDESTKNLYLVAQCAQRLAPSSSLRLHLFDENKQDLIPRAFIEDEKGLSFTVRSPLRAQLFCDKTKSTADCNPLLPLRLVFSAPVQADIAKQLQLTIGPDQQLAAEKPVSMTPFIDELVFAAPRVEMAELSWVLPADWNQLKDDDGRTLSNADFFQQPVKIAPLPPLLKFAHQGIGVLERFADASAAIDAPPALLPLAVRGVESSLLSPAQQQSAGQLRHLRVDSSLEMLQWFARLQRVGDYAMPEHALKAAWQLQEIDYQQQSPQVYPQSRSLFDALGVGSQTQQLQLPAPPDSQTKNIELIGLPLSQPGLHILEAKSQRLGATYLENDSSMYVRSAALVTNLAVHSKLFNDQLLVWLSRLDTAQPVANAHIEVLSCDGTTLATGTTDAQGRWLQLQRFEESYCDTTGLSALFITARINADHPDAYGQADSSFVLSSWDKGIESWRFQLPYYYGADQSEVVHTVSDRSLFLTGETVHLKHYWRAGTDTAVDTALPLMVIRHVGSGDEIKQDLQWQRSPTGGWYALSTLDLAKNATLGQYQVWLEGPQYSFNSADFRVEAFKLPYLTGTLGLSSGSATNTSLIAADSAVVDIQLNYISGGAAADQAVQITALTQSSTPSFSDYDDYQFNTADQVSRPQVVVDKAALVLNEHGAAQFDLALTAVTEPKDLVVEASFMDPTGQVQSLSQRQRLWPAAVVVGVKHPYWQDSDRMPIQGVVLNPAGDPLANQTVTLRAQKQSYYTTRQRMVGGFYRYDQQEIIDELGTVCETQTDAAGKWQCDVQVAGGGQIVLHSQSTDAAGRSYITESSLWLGAESQAINVANHDRMDVIPERKQAKPGDTIRFQVQSPFEHATALVAVEQDQLLHTEITTISRDQPFFDLQIQDHWGPNVYVSVLALRGRIYQTTWRDFLAGGWKSPLDWYKQYSAASAAEPTTQVDLAKPSFRYGIAQLAVANTTQAITVQLKSDQKVYDVAKMATLELTATMANGAPAANASVLLVGVDQALLELMPNNSWDLLAAMYPAIGYGVRTATMQSEVIGRRHYGRKAVAAGGGGGAAPTREIVDSLLLWRTDVVLDEQGRATVELPLNHSVTQFELVALVDQGGTHFGVGHAQIQTQQAIQIMSALPIEVRSGDNYQAVFTVRNRESESRHIDLKAQGFIDQKLVFDYVIANQTIAAQASAPFVQTIQMPEQLGANQGQIQWQLTASDHSTNEILDALHVEQNWRALVPVQTQQTIWQRLHPQKPQQLTMSLPAGALTEQGHYLGGVQLSLQPSLGGQQAVQTWFQNYPYTCFEQQASKYVALHDEAQWQLLMQSLPNYLDDKNLLRYFPSPYLTGSAALNSYILSLSAYSPDHLAVPADLAQKLLNGLHDYVEGRRQQPRVEAVEQVALYLSALDALARYDLIRPQMLDSIALAPEQWATSSLIDALHLLQHPAFDAQDRSALLTTIEQQLRQRLVQRGSALSFSDEALNRMPSLMVSPVTNQARLLLTVADLNQWQEHIPALMHGLLAQQKRGHWGTTTENSWALLALERIDQHHTATGTTLVRLGDSVSEITWAKAATTVQQQWGWDQNQPLQVIHQGNRPIWLQLSAQAAVPVTESRAAGYRVQRQITAVQQAQPGQWQVGDIYRVDLTIDAEHSSVWAVINDAIPAGAVILGSGLGRDTQLATATTAIPDAYRNPSYTERLASAYRGYFEYLPAGISRISYSVRLNTVGDFNLSPTTIESLYDSSVQAQLPVESIVVHAAP